MPYTLLPGGSMRRRRRRGRVVAALALAALAALVLAARAGDPRATGRAPGVVVLDAGTEPLAGGGTTPRRLAVRLDGARDAVALRLRHPPRAGLLFDLESGRVLWRRAPARVLPIASLTKIMTALLVAERLRPRTLVPITREALAYKGSGVGVLPRGRRMRTETLLHGLLLPSGNDAAIALAQAAAGGSVPRFLAAMNGRARRLGLTCTHFSSPSGYRDAGNHSCAADLAALARAVLRTPRLARIVRRRAAVLPFPGKGGRLYLYNNNPLLRMRYRGTTGVKTGYTDAAGRCLVASARRGGTALGVVLLHSPDPGLQARKLLDRGFARAR